MATRGTTDNYVWHTRIRRIQSFSKWKSWFAATFPGYHLPSRPEDIIAECNALKLECEWAEEGVVVYEHYLCVDTAQHCESPAVVYRIIDKQVQSLEWKAVVADCNAWDIEIRSSPVRFSSVELRLGHVRAVLDGLPNTPLLTDGGRAAIIYCITGEQLTSERLANMNLASADLFVAIHELLKNNPELWVVGVAGLIASAAAFKRTQSK